MSNDSVEPHGGEYEITVAPGIGQRMAAAFDGMDVIDGTRLRGRVVDQAALHCVLDTIHNLGLDLVDVHLVSR